MRNFLIITLCALFMAASYTMACGETPIGPDLSSSALTAKAWEALGKNDAANVFSYADKCVGLYKNEAARQQRSLKKFPDAGDAKDYEALNNVAACYFIKGEALFGQKRYEEAKACYRAVIEEYGFAQYWDPKGWYWKVAEKSQAVLDKIENVTRPEHKRKKDEVASPIEGLNFPLFNEGKEDIVDYAKYGEFKNVGAADYEYLIKDRKGLAEAAGVGIFPNNEVYKDPIFKNYSEKKLLEGSHWDYVNADNLQASFYKWAIAGEDPGVKLYYTAYALERAMHYKHAIKTYYSIVVNFPKTVSWTYWKTPWYVGQVAIDKIKYITRKHPELGMKLVDADIFVENGFDFDVSNDVITADPGRIARCGPEEVAACKEDLAALKVIKRSGGAKAELVQYENGHWRLNIDGRPALIKAVAYSPVTVGQSPDKGTLMDWSWEDYDGKGRIDGPYDSWVDKNSNNKKDPDEEAVGDFKLLKDMGANAIRVYHHINTTNRDLFRKMYEEYGLMALMGDFLGAYASSSGADWHQGTDYTHPVHQQKMKESVRKMVEEYKDEPYVIMWVLGNENNYGVANSAKRDPVNYYKFANEVAKMIKEMDPSRPVAICNGDTLYLDIFAKYAPDVDVYGCNSYRGQQGFGIGLWRSAKRLCDKPVLITEYGCPAYQKKKPGQLAEVDQAKYHEGEWEDILYNSAGYGAGNAIGGVVFEWLDEWWKAYEPDIHDTEALYTGPVPGGWIYEEWYGLAGQGNGSKSPFMRQLRESYYLYKKMWNEGNY